ncbi:MAG TPA: ATP-binding protein [Polyangia bacterium]|jgi:signal transduction histidine kinase
MKIGARITLTTVTLVLLTLGLYGWVSLRTRRAELTADLERQMELVGASVRVALEADEKAGRYADTDRLVARWQDAEPNIRFTYFDLRHARPGQQTPAFFVAARASVEKNGELPPGAVASAEGDEYVYLPAPSEPTRAQRLQITTLNKAPFGDHIEVAGKAIYALMEPVRDDQDRVVAAIELARNEDDMARAMLESRRTVIWALVALSALLAALIWLSTRASISNPLKRLVEAIDDVTHGDLGRVILRERDDEVGDLADRFNDMTGSLREAREEILHGVDAKLALEARLRHSEKLATIGQLAAGIAHEVGTPLNVIGGRARQLEKKAVDPAEVAKNAGIIATQTQRITKIIQQLLDFARRPASTRTIVDLHSVAKDCLDFLEHQLNTSRVDAKLRPFTIDSTRTDGSAVALLPPESPVVQGDADQLQQVCLNLCVNAIQAMPSGGALELATRALIRRRPGLDAADPGRYVVLEVSDTGVGIPIADRERIFEPFYTTKQGDVEKGGTGLGLAVSVGIVKDHDGWIEIDSRPEGGTVFRVFLPASERAELRASAAV